MHHATVIRHIDALEGRLGVKLFQRHARGYTATEAGADLCRVAQTTDDQFAQLAGRIKGQGDAVRGELVVTSLSGLSAVAGAGAGGVQRGLPRCHPALPDRGAAVPHGIRRGARRSAPGRRPSSPTTWCSRSCASARRFTRRRPMPMRTACPKPRPISPPPLRGHRRPESRAPFYKWLWETVPRAATWCSAPATAGAGTGGGSRGCRDRVHAALDGGALSRPAGGGAAAPRLGGAAVAGHPRRPAPHHQGAGVPASPQGQRRDAGAHERRAPDRRRRAAARAPCDAGVLGAGGGVVLAGRRWRPGTSRPRR